LSGGMSDEDGHLGLGDLSVVGPGARHRPVMDQAKHSYCLVAMERRAVMTGLFSRLRQLVNGY
jgi:anti-sigma factor ChrR (cupin superfamily)